jgi:hypothetical protein
MEVRRMDEPNRVHRCGFIRTYGQIRSEGQGISPRITRRILLWHPV